MGKIYSVELINIPNYKGSLQVGIYNNKIVELTEPIKFEVDTKKFERKYPLKCGLIRMHIYHLEISVVQNNGFTDPNNTKIYKEPTIEINIEPLNVGCCLTKEWDYFPKFAFVAELKVSELSMEFTNLIIDKYFCNGESNMWGAIPEKYSTEESCQCEHSAMHRYHNEVRYISKEMSRLCKDVKIRII